MNVQKPIRRLAMLLLAAGLFLAACKKEKKSSDEAFEPTPTPVGNVYGQATTATIGAQGGVVTTPDGKVQVTIPAGALSANTTISLQPVENMSPGGIGLNYRLLPHGSQFAKPVTIRFSYAKYTDSVSVPDALAIAFQDEDGMWKIPQGSTVDKVSKTVTVQTSHFSDWGLMKYLSLEPVWWALMTGERLTLRVVKYVEVDDKLGVVYKGTTEGPVAVMGKATPLDESMIGEWKRAGGGNLTPNGNTALYVAPAELPAQNPVAVSVQLKSSSTLLLIANIWIIPKKGVWIKLDGQNDILNYEDCRLTGENGELSLEWRATPGGTWQGGIGITKFTGAGQYAWSDDNQLWYEEPLRIGNHSIISFLEQGGQTVPSSGVFTLYRWDDKGKMCSGDFIIDNAGEYDANGTGAFVKTHMVRGFFNVLRE